MPKSSAGPMDPLSALFTRSTSDLHRPVPVSHSLPTSSSRLLVRLGAAVVLFAAAACTDEGTDMYNCFLAPDVPPIVVLEESATAANKKCEEEQGQKCTCTAIRSYRSVTGTD